MKRVMNKSILKKCLYCKTKFKAYSCEIERGNAKFCSKSCSMKKKILDNPYHLHDSPEQRFLKNIKISTKENGCWIWTGSIGSRGYGKISINNKTLLVHRYSYEYYKGKIPKDKIIMHICDQRECVNPKHLRAGTSQDNCLDMHEKGRSNTPRGSKHCFSKLNETDIKIIKKRLENGEMQKNIAKDYNVSQSNISHINRKLNWKHIL